MGKKEKMSRAFCHWDVWVVSPRKCWDERENTEWQRNRRWRETELGVNHPGCHLSLRSPVILELFSLISDYRRQSWVLSKVQLVAGEENKYILSVKFRDFFYPLFWLTKRHFTVVLTHISASILNRTLMFAKSWCQTHFWSVWNTQWLNCYSL